MGSSGPVKLGIIGYGFSTKVFHLPFIVPNPDLQVHAFLQREPSLLLKPAPSRPSRADEDEDMGLSPSQTSPQRTRRASLSTDVFPRAKRHRTAEEFFSDNEIEVVVVCSRDDTHAEFAERALRSGKHVVVEKPFARSVEEADRVIALAKEKGLLVTCFQNRRWDGDFLTLRKLVGEGALGTVTDAQMHYDFENAGWVDSWTESEYKPGSGMGMMYGLGSHSIDQTIVLFGRPKSVTGFLRSLREGIESEIEDTFTIVLQYEGDLIVTVKTTTVSVLREPIKYIVRGTGGSYIKVRSPLSIRLPEVAREMVINDECSTAPTSKNSSPWTVSMPETPSSGSKTLACTASSPRLPASTKHKL